jgi:G3E family GTPase
MPLYEQKWWKRLFGTEKHEHHEDSAKEIEAIAEVLIDSDADRKNILKLLSELEELEKERKVAASGIVQINLEAQARVLDQLLKAYQDYQDDVDINAIRLRRIAKSFLREAEKAGLKDVVKERKQDKTWQFWW